MLVHGPTLHAFTHNGDVDALQQETASIKTFCRLRITSFPTTILLVAHHRVKRWRIALMVLITVHVIRYALYTLTTRTQDILLLARYLHANYR